MEGKRAPTLKEQFLRETYTNVFPKVITVAVSLPSGAIEIITNTEDTYTKAQYYKNSYDEDFRLNHNKEIQIVGYMIV